jgi:hypothetical protein
MDSEGKKFLKGVNKMPTKSGAYVYLEDGSNANQVYVANQIDTNIQPVDIQSRLATTIQTHNAVSVALSSNSLQSTWVDCDGFDKLAVTLLNGAVGQMSADVYWSNDGTSNHGFTKDVVNINSTLGSGITDIKARYAKIAVVNGDSAAAHTMSAWAYLKA